MKAQGRTFDQIAETFGYSRSQAFRLTQIARQKLNARLKRQARAGRDTGPTTANPARRRQKVKM